MACAKALIWRRIVAVFGLLSSGCADLTTHPTANDISKLASDVYVVVGDVPLKLPVVALAEYAPEGFSFENPNDRSWAVSHLDGFLAQARSRDTALQVTDLEVRLRPYGLDDFNPATYRRLCGQLSQGWALSVCDDASAPLLQALPNRLHLFDLRKVSDDTGVPRMRHGAIVDLRRRVELSPTEPTIWCEASCVAMTKIDDHLGVFWELRSEPEEGRNIRMERQARAIAAFVNLGLRSDDYPKLLGIVCELRAPDAYQFNKASLCGNGPGLPS